MPTNAQPNNPFRLAKALPVSLRLTGFCPGQPLMLSGLSNAGDRVLSACGLARAARGTVIFG